MPDENKCGVLGVRGLKKEYGFSEGLQRKKRKDGNFIPFFLAGNRVRYRRAAVEAWIAEQEQLAQRGQTVPENGGLPPHVRDEIDVHAREGAHQSPPTTPDQINGLSRRFDKGLRGGAG